MKSISIRLPLIQPITITLAPSLLLHVVHPSLIGALAFLSFPQTLFSSYGSYNNRLKICLLFFLPSIDFACSIVYGEREGEAKDRGVGGIVWGGWNEVETSGKRITLHLR